jgi:hypothetical protein
MKISVKLLATYRSKLPADVKGNTFEIEVAEGSQAVEVIEGFGIPIGEASVILVNGRPPEPGELLKEDDVVCAFPAMAGG